MILPPVQALTIIVLIALGTLITRALPFIIFPSGRETPKYVLYLGKVLPFSVMGLLIVYCLKNVSLTGSPYGIPEGIAIISIILLHLWKKNTLLSIGAGTIIYMVLVQFVF